MMIVSKLKIEFPDAPWAMMNGARARAQQLLEAVVQQSEAAEVAKKTTERFTLSELLYRALVEPLEVAS